MKVFLLAGPSPSSDTLLDLIVAIPQHNTRVVPSPPDLLPHLQFDALHHLSVGRVDSIAEHEIVKYHDALDRCQLQELR
jgi:hypothetical protein